MTKYLVLVWRGEWQPLGYNDAPHAVLHDNPTAALTWAEVHYLDDNPDARERGWFKIVPVICPAPPVQRPEPLETS